MNAEKVLSFFREITCIPRESGHEEHIIAYLQKFATDHNFDCKTDEAGNVLITKPAAKGCEDRPTIILQSHTDMVCEKNSGFEHDFAKDPIPYIIKDGWMIAENTTLGADCGIGIAAELAVLCDDGLKAGKIECLFTCSEETGMDGAFGLQPGFLTGKILLNLDSEDEGELFIGCSGGIDTTAEFKYTLQPLNKDLVAAKFSVSGGIGGHSGDDIHKGRANSVQLIARFLYAAFKEDDTIELCTIAGGNKRNAIAREASAVIAFNPDNEDKIIELFNKFSAEIKDEYEITDPNIKADAEPVTWKGDVIDRSTALRLIASLNAAPHGVLAMSAAIPGLVETSSNLASVKMVEGNIIRVGTNQRSSIKSASRYAAQRVEAAFAAVQAEVSHNGEYPGWKPKLDSHILEVTRSSYLRLFGNEPIIRAIHAGLECGLFLDIYPDLDMISFGPTIRGVHAPGEKLELSTVDKFCALLDDVIKNA
ncbi:MAG: aminoacyl-histidine dipeptidase [Bacteroidales bacterium]|nr:aminoacyl-histidine dipeptidase [Bacteroidales bacterium]